MFWILPRFGKIGVCILQHWILVAMAKLPLQAHIPRIFVVLSFGGTLRRILIGRAVRHIQPRSQAYEHSLRLELSE